MILPYLVAPISGNEPGEKDFTIVQKMTAQLEEIKAYVIRIRKLEAEKK